MNDRKEDGVFEWDSLVHQASQKGPDSVEWGIVNAAVHSCWSSKLKTVVSQHKAEFKGVLTQKGGYVVEWPNLIDTASKVRFLIPIPKFQTVEQLQKRFGKEYIQNHMTGMKENNTFVIMCQMRSNGPPPPILFCLTAIY